MQELIAKHLAALNRVASADDKPFQELENLFQGEARWDELLSLYESRASNFPDSPGAPRILARAGDLVRTRLNNLARAEQLYRRALVAQRNDPSALEGLKVIYESRGDLAALADVLERRAAALPPGPAAGVWSELGQVYERLGRRDRAVLAYQRAARGDPTRHDAAERAFDNLVQLGRWRLAVDALDTMRQRFGPEGLAPKYALVAEALIDLPPEHPLALRAAKAALELDPADERAKRAHDAVAGYKDTWRERVRTLRLAANEERDRKRMAGLFLSVALAHATYDVEADARKRSREFLDRALLLWPGMPQALDAMERMAADSNDWKGLETLYDRLANDAKERGAAVEIMLRLATLRVVRFGDRQGALAALLKACALDPSRAETAGLAAEFLLDEGRGDEAAAILEKHLNTLAEPRAQLTLRMRLAELFEKSLQDPAGARRHLEAALQLDHGLLEAAQRLIPAYEASGDWQKLVEVLEASLPGVTDAAAKADRLERIADLHGEMLDRPADAVRALSRALVLAPERPTVARALEKYATLGNAWEAAVAAYEAAADVATPDASRAFLRRAAEILEAPLGRLSEAIAVWRQLLERDPSDVIASQALESLLARTGAHEELAASYEKQLAKASGAAEQRAVLEKMARAIEGAGADPAAAAEVYRRMLRLDPRDADVVRRLGKACAALERWDEVAETAQRLAELANEPGERREWQARRAQVLAERLNRKEEAAELYLELLRAEPGRPGVVPALEKIGSAGVLSRRIAEALLPVYLAAGDWGRAATSLQTQVTGTDDPAARCGLVVQLARLCEEKLADRRAAFGWYEKAFRLSPGDSGLSAELERLAAEIAAPAELAAIFMDVADRIDEPALSLKLLLRSAQLAAGAAEYDLALQALELALVLPEGRREALRTLQQLSMRAERWADGERAIRMRLETEPEARAELLPELALVCERLGKHAEAAKAVEGALAGGGREADLLPKLSRYYEQAGDAAGLKSALSRELQVAERSGERDRAARLRLRLSRLLEGSGGDWRTALENYAAVLAERPSDPEALAALEKMLQAPEMREAAARALAPAYEATKEFRKLVYALEIFAESTSETAERLATLRRVAHIHAVDLRQIELAFATLARALRLAPADAQLRVATRKVAEECNEIGTYAEVLAEAAETLPGKQAIPLLRELAEVSERKLGSREEAATWYRHVLTIEPENLDALRGLHRLLRLAGDWAGLADVCQRLARVIYDEQERILLYREAGLLFEGTLKRPDEAAVCFRALAEADPLDRDAAIALERLYETLQRPQDLAFALELRRAQEGGNAAGREAAFKLAELKRNTLNDPAGALQIYGQILGDDPAHAGVRQSLETWARAGGAGSLEAMKLIDPVLERAGEHPRRVALRESRLEGAAAAEKAQLSAEIRRIQELDMGRPELAFLSACSAFRAGIDREKVQPELERLARETGSMEELADVYEVVAAASQPGEEQGGLALRRAAQLRSQLGEAEKAVSLWKDLLAETPGDREALEALAKLHERSQNARELSEVYRQQAALAQEPAQRAQLLLQAGTARLHMGDHAGAVELGRAVMVIAPKHRAALELLDEAYGPLHQPREHADVLRLLAEATDDAPARRAVLLRRAALLERDGEAAEAVDAYQRVLADSPGESAAVAGLERLFQKEQARALAARVLEPFYRSVDDGRHLADVLEVRAAQSPKEERLGVMREIARLREALGQRQAAFGALLRCFHDEPQDPAVREELERLAAETGAFEELAAAYEDELERGCPDALQLELWRRLGAIHGDRLGRPDRAAQAWEEVHRRSPGDDEVLETLSRIYRRTSRPRELAAVLWRQVERAATPARRRELLVELAALSEEKLADREGAIGAWREIRKLAEDDAQAIAALHRLLGETGRFDELAELLAARVALAEKQGKAEEALELKLELGRVKLARLADPRGALALFTEVLTQRPGHPGAVAALEEMAGGEGGLRAEAALALEPVFAEGGEHLKLVQMLEARAQASQPAEKAALLRRVAELYAGPLSSADMAFVYAGRALEAFPDDAQSLAACVKWAEAAGTREELAALLDGVADKARGDDARIAIQRALARVLAADTTEAEAAIAAYRKLLELAPGDPEALDGLGALYRDLGQWGDLLEVLRRQLAGAATPEARVELLRRIGELQEERLSEYSAAIASFRRVLELAPDDAAALERLDRLCQRTERWAELADTLAREIDLAQRSGRKEAQLALKFRLAQVRELRLLDRAGALTLYREILQARPGSAETVARLEEIVQRDPSWDDAAEALAEAYRAVSNHGKLARLLEERAGSAGEGAARKKHLAELARIRSQHLERPDLAFLALCKALREDPSDAETRRALEKAAEQAEAQEELAALYEEELPRLDGADAGEVCLRLGQLYEQKLNDRDQAITFYEKARAFEPARGPQVLPALDRLYKETGQWEHLADVLASLVALAEEPSERTALLFRLGQLADEKLDPPSPDRAARAYAQILEIDPAHLPAARALEKLYEAARRFDRLFEIVELQRSRASGPERERLTARLAEIAANGLKDPAKAIELYNEVLALNPRSEAAFLALEGLYEDTHQSDTLVELLRRRLAITVDPREITRLSDKTGRVLAALGRHEEAITAFRAALERDPRHRKALESLREIYEGYAPGEELATVLRRLVPLQDDTASVKKVRLRLAEVLAALGRRDEALESARRVLDAEPHDADGLLRAEALFRSLGSFGDLIRAMETRAEVLRAAGDVPGAISVLYAVAEVHGTQLNKREAAAPTYERILDLGVGERPAFDALREIYAAQNSWRQYAAACEKYLPGAKDVGERVEILKDLGSVHETRLGHKDLAFLPYCRAFGEAPQDEALQQAVHRVAEQTGSFDELATVYEEIVERVERGPVAERLYLALAKIQDEKLDDAEAAEASLRKVLEFDPANRAALEALATMFSRRGRDSDYVVSLEQKYEAAATIEERKAILREIATTCDVRLRKPEDAAAAWLRALELEPDRETFRAAADLFRREKKWPELTDLLVRARDFETEPQLRSRLQFEVAEVYEREIRDDEAAVAGYHLALEFDPENRDALYALERLYTKLDRARELLSVYEAQLHLADPRERVKVLFKSAGIWEDKFQNLENADACLEAVFAVDPANLQAVKGLERLRRTDAERLHSAARWEDLLRAYDRHLSLKPDVAEQVELLVAMGEVHYKELKRIDRAAQIFHRALELDPRSRQAMHALGLLYERSGNWPFALDMLAREAELLGTSSEAVELYHRIGKINEEMLLDAGSAKQAYLKALEIDEGYLPSLRCLKGLYSADKDWDNFLRVLVQEAQHTDDPEDRAVAFLEVARFYQDSREDRDNAAHFYEEALKLVPDSLDAAKPLADIYMAREDWERAEGMLDIVATRLSEGATRDPHVASEVCRQLYRLGYVCEKLKKAERALGAYERAYSLDATYLPSAEGYANLLVASGRHADALAAYQAILIHHREDLTDLEVVEYYWQVGDLYRKLGQLERAQKEFEKALAIDSNHEPSLRAQIELSESLADWESALEFRSRLLAMIDGPARFELLVASGRTAREKLNDPYRAIEAYAEALKVVPDAPEVLEALLGLYRETRQSARAVEVLERLLANPAVAKDPARARKLLFTLGEIYRDEIKDPAKAVEAFNRALDVDFRFVQAFAAIETLLGSTRQWDALEANYHRMMQRLPKTDDTHAVRMALFKTLGDFYEKVKKDKKATRQVYQVVVRGQPDDTAALEKLAELSGEEDGAEREAIDAWRKALPASGNPQRVVHELARLFAKVKDYDEAYVAAQVSVHLLGESGADESEILKKLGPYAKRREQAQKPLTNNMWGSLLYHPKVRGPMGDILALVYDKLGAAYARKPSAFGVDARSDRIDLQASSEFAISAYKYVLGALDTEAMELYSPFLVQTRERLRTKSASQAALPDRELLVELLDTHPVSLKAGGKLFSENSPKELYFALARAVTFARPELALARLLPAERLEAVFQAAVMTGVPGFRPTADPRALQAELKVLEKLEPQFRAALARLGREYARTATPDDVRNFIEGAELTANRAAALLCADVEAAKAALAREPSKVPMRARIRDLMLFCLSPEHAELRAAMGLKLEIKLPGGRR